MSESSASITTTKTWWDASSDQRPRTASPLPTSCSYATNQRSGCVGSLAESSSMRAAGRPGGGAWTGEEVELGWGLAEGLKELLSCYE
ncbi:hypothetical protein CRUP_016301 [Coryphaenoides rupestris]|nr:hypothetical protein CRUP_016301 [Coryphaenoides rupestris]